MDGQENKPQTQHKNLENIVDQLIFLDTSSGSNRGEFFSNIGFQNKVTIITGQVLQVVEQVVVMAVIVLVSLCLF
jgi:hypothetical protein